MGVRERVCVAGWGEAAGATHRPVDASGSEEVVRLLTLLLPTRQTLPLSHHVFTSCPLEPPTSPLPSVHQSNGSILSGMGCTGQLALKGIAHHK